MTYYLSFLLKLSESLDVVDAELVKFESDPNDKDILDKIFRLVHTIKGLAAFWGCRALNLLPMRVRPFWANSATVIYP